MPKTVRIDAGHPGENVKVKVLGTTPNKPFKLTFTEKNANVVSLTPKTYQPGSPPMPVTISGPTTKSVTITPGVNGWIVAVAIVWNAMAPAGGLMKIEMTVDDTSLKFVVPPDMKSSDGPAVLAPITFVSSSAPGGVDQQMAFVLNLTLL